MYQAGLVGLPSPEKRARTNYPSPGVFTTARIWPKQDCHRRCARGRNEVGDINLQPLPGKDSLI